MIHIENMEEFVGTSSDSRFLRTSVDKEGIRSSLWLPLLSDGRAIKITTSKYYTPSGASIHGDGISPDVLIEADETRDLLAGIASHETDSGKALLQTDSQLREALGLLQNNRLAQSDSQSR